VTRREHEVLRLVSDGLTPKEIAAHLHISVHTVKHHMKNASSKLKAQNGKHAVALYVRAHG
jgi:DNA-binding CsgD family transcriptional regulator